MDGGGGPDSLEGEVLPSPPQPDPSRPGLFSAGGRTYTRSPQGLWRGFSPNRSKLASYLKAGGTVWPLRPTSHVLYLGAAAGTTASHVADCCPQGQVVAVEKAERPLRELLALGRARANVVPVHADASQPERYAALVGPVDVLYQDVAAPDQGAIALANMSRFCTPSSVVMIMVKARSIDAAAVPADVVQGVLRSLRGAAEVLDRRELAPFARDHAALVLQPSGPR